MKFKHHPNFEIAEALVKLKDGVFSSHELESAPRFDWYPPRPLINAHPDRRKLCPLCLRSQPIDQFLIDLPAARTIAVYGSPAADICADVREWCLTCDRGQNIPYEETTHAE